MSEADRYLLVPSWEDRIHSYEDISAPLAQDESKDSTLEHIRHNLVFASRSSMETCQEGLDNPGLDYMHVTDSDKRPTFLDSDDEDLVSRVHTQIIHTYTGYLLHHFKDLKELLQVILDVVEGEQLSTHWLEFSNKKSEHKYLYYNGRILHRDISSENIIIMPQNGDTVGRLIDLDHAKVVRSSRTIEAFNSNQEVEDLEKLCNILFRSTNHEGVIERFIKYFEVEDAISTTLYISNVVECRKNYFGLDVNHGVKLDDIGWHYQVGWNSV